MSIKRNAIRCDTCLAVIESTHRHDFHWCDCEYGSGTEVAVDGGHDYLKRCWGASARYTELSERTCPGCGCLVPANEEIKRCNVCGHDVCDGCATDNGWCQLCADIKEERER